MSSSSPTRSAPPDDVVKNFLAPALQSADLSFWRWDLQTNMIESTYDVASFLNPDEVFHNTPFDRFMSLVYDEDRAYLLQTLQSAIDTGENRHAEFRYYHKGKYLRWFAADCHIVKGEDGKPRWMAGTRCDVTAKKRTEDVILRAAKAVSSRLGADYANSLVASLSELLDAYSVCIALRSEADPSAITSVARFCEGGHCASVDYPLDGSPFPIALREGFYVCPRDLADSFPDYDLFKRERMESYIGVAIHASDGSVLGLLHASWRQPLPDVALATSVFRFFAVRAGAEMERKRVEERLLQQTRILELSSQTAQIGGWEFSPLAQTLYWTHETYRIHETSPAEYSPSVETAIRFYTPESAPIITEAVHLALTQSRPYDLELQIVTVKGNLRWVRTHGRVQMEGGMVLKLYGSFQDITEQKIAQQELHSSQANLSAVLESLNDVIFSVDKDLNLLTINTNGAEFMQRSFGTFARKGVPLHSLAPPEYGALWTEEYARALQGETITVMKDASANGQASMVEAHFNPIISHGEATGVVVRANDVTERVRRQERLAQSQKLEALGELAGGVAHDFNNFLLVIMGYADLLRGCVADAPAALKYIDYILRASSQANSLTTQLLSFARRQNVTPKVFNLNRHIQMNANMLLHLVGEQVEIVIERGDADMVVRMDSSQLNQLMMNLVINARDAMPRGGKLTISTRKVSIEAEDEAHIGLGSGEHCVLQVADTGVGMSEETMRRIFEPLFTTKPLGKGTGFGLSICYSIAKQAGGFIHAESELGEGSVFSVYLPYCNEPLAESEAAEAEGKALSDGATILLVEDDPAVRDITAHILEARGYKALVARSPEEAVSIAKSDARIDMLLTDVVMPQMNGREVSAAVAALRPGIKTLYVSGYTQDVFDSQEIMIEEINLLPKPFTANQLVATIRETLEGVA